MRDPVIVTIRRQLRVNRMSLTVMTALMLIFVTVQVQAYQSAFPDPRTRATLLAGLTGNGALRALYGHPYDIGTATGWLSWRGMSSVALIMAVWASFITIGALRGEEESGRADLVLSQPRSRRLWLVSAMLAVAIETLVIGTVAGAGLLAIGVSQGLMTPLNCMGTVLQLVLPALLFAAVGLVAGQLAGTARGARLLVTAVLGVAFFLRTAADTGSGLEWLRWATPLGWLEELHPPAAPAPAALIAIAATGTALVLTSLRMLRSRDIGLGLLPRHDRRRPRLLLLGAPWQEALRDAALQLCIWVSGGLLFTLLMGGLTASILTFVESNSSIAGVVGSGFGLNAYLALVLSLIQLLVALLAVSLVAGACAEEVSGRLELLMAAPQSRRSWLVSRTGLAAAVAFSLALLCSVALWAGAGLGGRRIDLSTAVGGALNAIPVILICAGGAAALLAVRPRAMPFVYAPIAAAYLWEGVGSALKAPPWALDLSPFHAVSAVPREQFAIVPATVLGVLGVGSLMVATSLFRRRDLAQG